MTIGSSRRTTWSIIYYERHFHRPCWIFNPLFFIERWIAQFICLWRKVSEFDRMKKKPRSCKTVSRLTDSLQLIIGMIYWSPRVLLVRVTDDEYFSIHTPKVSWWIRLWKALIRNRFKKILSISSKRNEMVALLAISVFLLRPDGFMYLWRRLSLEWWRADCHLFSFAPQHVKQ